MRSTGGIEDWPEAIVGIGAGEDEFACSLVDFVRVGFEAEMGDA